MFAPYFIDFSIKIIGHIYTCIYIMGTIAGRPINRNKKKAKVGLY